MQAVLIIIHLLVAVALICVVLLQRSEGGALGMGGGGSGLGGLFSPRGAASTLTRTTAILGLVFFITSMSLTLLSLGARQPTRFSIRSPPERPRLPIPSTAHFALPCSRSAADSSECQPGCSRCARASSRPADTLSRLGARDFPGMNLLVATRKRLSEACH